MQPIVFIHSLSVEEQQQWLELLGQLMPSEQILMPKMLNDAQALEVEVAIVANPDPSDLAKFPNLVWIQSVWAGVEGLVKSFKALAKDQNKHSTALKLVRLKDPQLAQTMAEAVLAWTLYLHRNMPEYAAQQVNRQWKQLPNISADQVHVAVLGSGELGLSAINSLIRHGFKVSCWSRSAKQITGATCYHGLSQLPLLLGKINILINLLPLTADTKGLLDKTRLGCLPQGAKLINFSRGAVVNHTDLIELLDAGQLSHAVLDVFEEEPLKRASSLWSHPKITVLPHISAPTNVDTAAKVVANNINNYRLTGTVPESVDLGRGY